MPKQYAILMSRTLKITFSLFQINDASNMEELYAAIDDASTLLEIAGCNIPAKTIEDKTKILNFTIKFYAIHRASRCIDRCEQV